MAGRYYGLDRQYFTTVIDYGFSKRLEEALAKWGRENVLRDVVRDDPHGSPVRADRALPGQRARRPRQPPGGRPHHAGGVSSRPAIRRMFPSRSATACAPWQPLKLYMGGVREDEDWTLRIDTGEYSPWLGDSYQTFSRLGLSFQRSQNGGRAERAAGTVGRLLQAAGVGGRRACRRRRSSSTASTRRSRVCSARFAVPRRRRCRAARPRSTPRSARRSRVLDAESVGVACRRSRAAWRRRATAIDAAARRAGRRVHPAGQGAAVHGRDQHRARHRLQAIARRYRARSCRDSGVDGATPRSPTAEPSTSSVDRDRRCVAGWPTGGVPASDARAAAGWPRIRPPRHAFAVTVPDGRAADAPVLRARVDRGAALHAARRHRSSYRPAAEPALTARARYRCRRAGRDPRDRPAPRAAPAVRRRAARADGRAGAWRSTWRRASAIVPLRRRARQAASRFASSSLNNVGRRQQRTADAAAAGRLDVDARGVAVHVRARRRAQHLPVHRLGAGAREPRLPDRGGRDRRRTRVHRGLRRHRAPRSRDAVSLSSVRRRRCAAST